MALPLPNFCSAGGLTEQAVASAALLYDFTSSVTSGTAVINLNLTGSASVSTTLFPNNDSVRHRHPARPAPASSNRIG